MEAGVVCPPQAVLSPFQGFPARGTKLISREAFVSLFFYFPKQKGCSGGSDLLSPIGLSSALEYFTSVFGMGTGGTTPE